jgi:hypothetical protein
MLIQLSLLAAILLAAALVVLGRRHLEAPTGVPIIRVFGVYSPLLTWLVYRAKPSVRQPLHLRLPHSTWERAGPWIEILAIGLWALWVGRSLLDFNPLVWPAGREFGRDVYAFHFWEQLRRCGLCGLWNGSLNGGWPFLSDPFTGHLHPLPALATLFGGVVNGAKITLLVSFFLAGLGQWWIASVIGLGRWSRLWTALVATSGGHLVGRVELGSVADPLAASAAILALAAAFDLALNRNRKAALRMGLLLGLALLAGHGYYQLALIGWIPWVFLILFTPEGRADPVGREFALAAALAALVAAIFLVPFLHFWPQMVKDTDATFGESQPLEYIPINLVVRDWPFLNSPVLDKMPYPYLHTLFIGWAAVVLAVVAIARIRRADRRLVASLSLGALTMMWVASGVPMRWLVGLLPILAGFRHVASIAALAVPAILALSGYGLDRLLELSWPRLQVGLSTAEYQTGTSASLAWLLVIPLGLSLRTMDQLDRFFLRIVDSSGVYQGIGGLPTSPMEWVSLPFGEHYWIEPALSAGLKVTHVAAPWAWRERIQPPPLLEATRDAKDGALTPAIYLNDLPVYSYPSNEYAYVDTGSEAVPCAAQGSGGDIRVTCVGPGGLLVVRENSWTGWTVKVNGEAAPIEQGQWLAVAVPEGTVEVRFRYLPADAALGASLTIAGLLLASLLWVRAARRAKAL